MLALLKKYCHLFASWKILYLMKNYTQVRLRIDNVLILLYTIIQFVHSNQVIASQN